MLLVLISNNSNVIGKNVYEGDDLISNQLIDKEQISNPLLAYRIVDQKTFDNTTLSPMATKDETDWQTEKSKGTGPAIDFIAKKLGFE